MSQEQDEAVLEKFEGWLVDRRLSSSTIVNYLADLRTFMRWGEAEVGSEFSLAGVNQEHIRLYRYHLTQQRQRASSTVNRHLMALRKFFIFAQETNVVPVNPTSGVALVQNDGQAISRPLSNDDIEKILKAADNPGLRLRVHNGQEDKIRYLPLCKEVCKSLNEYLDMRPKAAVTDHFFLNQQGHAVSDRTVQRIVSDSARAAGLEGISAQSLRRTFALQLLEETKDIDLVSQRLGHQNSAITAQYLAVHEINDANKTIED